jgi:hypothetical protein
MVEKLSLRKWVGKEGLGFLAVETPEQVLKGNVLHDFSRVFKVRTLFDKEWEICVKNVVRILLDILILKT